MKLTTVYGRLIVFLRRNFFLTLFFSVIAVVGVVVLLKLLTAETQTVYAKVKISQGLWWANTTKPAVWLAEPLQKGLVERNLSGQPIVEILSVRSYPWWNSEQYDVYVVLKLDVTKNSSTGRYTFKRAPLAIGSPVDLEFPEVQVSGTVMELSDEPLHEKRRDLIVTVEKKYADEWEANGLEIGDTYFDREEVVLEVLEKQTTPASEVYIRVGNQYPYDADERTNIQLKLRLRVLEKNGQFVFREDQPLQLGRYLNAQTQEVVLQNYAIAAIENVVK